MATRMYKIEICFAKLFFKHFLKNTHLPKEQFLNDLIILEKIFKKKISTTFQHLNTIPEKKVNIVLEKVINFLQINKIFLIYFKFLWYKNMLGLSSRIIKSLKDLVLVYANSEECLMYFSHDLPLEIMAKYETKMIDVLHKKVLFKTETKPGLCLGFRILVKNIMIEKSFSRNWSQLIIPFKN